MKIGQINKLYEEFDKTKQFPWTRKKLNLTLAVSTIDKLKDLSKKYKMPISRIIDKKFDK